MSDTNLTRLEREAKRQGIPKSTTGAQMLDEWNRYRASGKLFADLMPGDLDPRVIKRAIERKCSPVKAWLAIMLELDEEESFLRPGQAQQYREGLAVYESGVDPKTVAYEPPQSEPIQDEHALTVRLRAAAAQSPPSTEPAAVATDPPEPSPVAPSPPPKPSYPILHQSEEYGDVEEFEDHLRVYQTMFSKALWRKEHGALPWNE